MQKALDLLRHFCRQLCANSFENSEEACVATHESSLKETAATSQKIVLSRRIQQFCQTHQNRFWILYYRTAEKKTMFACRTCGSEADRCKDYVLDRIVKHIKAFDITRESEVYAQVRLALSDGMQSEGVVHGYVERVRAAYETKRHDVQTGVALVENALYPHTDKSLTVRVGKVLDHYRAYQVSMVLKKVVMQSAGEDETACRGLQNALYEELLHLEKFHTYITMPVKTRVIDFTRVKGHEPLLSDTLDEHILEEETEEAKSDLLHLIDGEAALLYKLKYGFTLENHEFVEVIIRLDYENEEIIEVLSYEERFYIQLVTKYGLKPDSEFLRQYDITALERSIGEKISVQREKLLSRSYKHTQTEGKEEVYFKLLYTEPLSSAEMGILFGLSAKQIDKKVENAKNRIRKQL